MFNIYVGNENRRELRLTWFVTEGARPQLRSRWLIQDSPDTVKGIENAFSELRNQPVTKACDTQMIAAWVRNRPSRCLRNVGRIA
jgi:hypothetical protein